MRVYQRTKLLLALFCSMQIGCKTEPVNNEPQAPPKASHASTIHLQPFAGIPHHTISILADSLRTVFPSLVVLPEIPLPDQAFFKPRNRYKADSLLVFLKKQTPVRTTSLGVTASDISTSNPPHSDWGIMGLSYCPGNASVVSTWRLSKSSQSDQLFKVAIHELGHAEGLPHCLQKTCFMRDAEGKNPTNEEVDFCVKCKSFLRTHGWKLK
jgi:archaemetzincin